MLGAFDFKRSAASTEKGSDLTDSKHSKTSWKKSDMKLCNYFELDSDSIGKNKKQNDKNSCTSNKNSSTLSLHIAAYENFIENENSVDASDTLKDLKKHGKSCLNMQILGSKTSADMMNPFEFPRQQENKKYPESEISQFRASQRLFTPNQSSSSTQGRRIHTHQNNLQDPQNALTLGSNNDDVRRPPSATVRPDRYELRNGERIQQLQRSPSISILQMPSTPVNLERNGNLQNLQHQLAIQKDVSQQIQQPPAAAASTPSDSRAVPENVTGQLTHSESSSNNNRAVRKMAQHHQRRDEKFQAIMAIAEEIVGEADFEPKDFGSQLNQRCKNAGVQGAKFGTSWYHYVEYVKKRWQENGNEFTNVNDERFADIQRRLDASYCMHGQSSPHDSEDRSSNSNINEGNESNDRSNRRQRRAATPGPSSKRIRHNASDPPESPQTNPPVRQRLDFLLPPMNSRPVAPQFSNHERLQQIYIDRFNEQQREYDNRNSFPPRDGFHGDHSSSMPSCETAAENEEQNGSGKESSTKSDMISASELENVEPQVQPVLDDVPVPANPDSVSLSDPVENVETASAATENQEQHQITDIMARQIDAMIQHSEIQTSALKDFMNKQVETLSKMNQK